MGNSSSLGRLRSQLLADNMLYIDPEFPPLDSSVFYDPKKRFLKHPIEWKRPPELTTHARRFANCGSNRGVRQGELGDCWLIAGCLCLAERPDLLRHMFPEAASQDFDSAQYCGVMVVRFWRFGRWVDVMIDDLLPTFRGRLVFAQSSPHIEYWCCLVEKAAAKLAGCYESLCTGTLSEALLDLSGGTPESFFLRRGRVVLGELKHTLVSAWSQSALVTAAIEPRPGEMEEMMECGLTRGHSYAMTAVRQEHDGTLRVRLEDPFGQQRKVHWIGDSTGERAGRFWLSWADFCSYFTDLCVGHLPPPGGVEVAFVGKWKTSWLNGRHRAGGCSNFLSHVHNPQYLLTVAATSCLPIVLMLVQSDKRRLHKGPFFTYKTIGLHVLQAAEGAIDNRCRLEELTDTVSVALSDFLNARSISVRLTVPAGEYVIIPSTYWPGQSGRFIVRSFLPAHSTLIELS